MISGDRLAVQGKQGAFWYTLAELSKYWDRVDVICPHVKNGKWKMENGKLNNVFFYPSPRKLWYQPWWILKKGKELIEKYDCDVMTVHEYPPFYNGYGALKLAKKTGIPFMLEIHHIVGWPIAASFSEKLFRPLSRIFLPKESKAASAVRTVNSSVLSTLKDFGIPEEKIELLPSFYLDSKILVQKNEIKKDFDLVFAGRLVVNKGLDRLLAAIETLPSIRLLVIGDGPQRKYEEAHAKRLNIADRVVFVGWQSTQEEVMNAIQRAKIFVLPSKSEGGPRVALEAMACGMPVLTTPVGVMQDTIRNGENGLLTTGEPEDIAEKISLLLSDEDWCKKIGNEAKNILNEFNKEALVRKYAEFLQSLVHNNQTML